MSWTHELHIGEMRTWPDGIKVWRGNGFDVRYYVPERYPHEWEIGSEFARLEEENAKLRELLSQALSAHECGTFWDYFEPHSFWKGWCKDVHGMGIEVDDE